MAITVVDYPLGHPLESTVNQADVTDSGGDALFTDIGHGSPGYIYILSNIRQYNGYWYLDTIDADTFKIRAYPTADPEPFVISSVGTVAYYGSLDDCNWHSVHLPIVYKLKSDKWPLNGVDSSRTVTTFTNWNGYTYLVLNGDIKATGVAATLDNVILSGVTGVGGVDISGIYRIVQWFSDTNIVIDLEYDGGNVISGGVCQYYYLHYHARVKIYAGMDPAHSLQSVKPYEEIAEVKVPFDNNGIGTLNVAEFVKSRLDVLSNDLQLATLPNNINAWCDVYISVAESYDDSDGYTIEEYVGAYSDNTNPVRVCNARLPFKTRSSGAMDAYVWGQNSGSLGKFLTPFVQPVLFSDNYFDLSWIYQSTGQNRLKIDRYAKANDNYTLISSAITTLSDLDYGVFRYPISQTGSEDRIDVTLLHSTLAPMSETLTIDVDNTCSPYDTSGVYLTWLNYLGGFDYWFFKAQSQYSVDVLDSKTQEININNQWPSSYGEFADSITKQSVRTSKNVIRVSSQYLTKDQMDGIAWIVSSPLVQILTTTSTGVVDVTTARTVIVDTSTLRKYQDRDNLYSISFTVAYTDELPVQTL